MDRVGESTHICMGKEDGLPKTACQLRWHIPVPLKLCDVPELGGASREWQHEEGASIVIIGDF